VRKRGEDQLAKEKENYNVDINHNFKAEISRDELSAKTWLRMRDILPLVFRQV